jgi:hypothetical protein
MKKEFKFNFFYDENGDSLKEIVIESLVNYLQKLKIN